jgi:hypothetical protein
MTTSPGDTTAAATAYAEHTPMMAQYIILYL